MEKNKKKLGPPIVHLTNKILSIPNEFISEPILKNSSGKILGQLPTIAFYFDFIYYSTGKFPTNNPIFNLYDNKENKNQLIVITIIIYLLTESWIKKIDINENQFFEFLTKNLKKYTDIISYKEFLTIPDKSEELCRLIYKNLNILPDDETNEYFEDRTNSLDTIYRQEVLKKSKEAQLRILKEKELREAMRRKEAEEAASKMPRE
jgi:hypothetical protein